MKQILFVLFISSIHQSYTSEKEPEIHELVEEGNIPAIEALLNKDPNKIEKRGAGWGNTPLLTAVFCEQPEVVDYLIEMGAKADAVNDHGENAFHLLASYEGSNNKTLVAIAKSLEAVKVPLMLPNNAGYTPAESAAIQCQALMLERLIKAGVPVNHKFTNPKIIDPEITEETLLFQAAFSTEYTTPGDKLETVKTLLRLGASVDIPRKIHGSSWFPLDAAIISICYSATEILLIANSPLTSENYYSGPARNGLTHLAQYGSSFFRMPTSDREEEDQKEQKLFITALACFQLYKRPDLNNLLTMPDPKTEPAAFIANYLSPERVQSLQPAVERRKTELLTDTRYRGILLPQKLNQIAAQKRGLTLYQYLQFQKKSVMHELLYSE